jgi:hypothetical protein
MSNITKVNMFLSYKISNHLTSCLILLMSMVLFIGLTACAPKAVISATPSEGPSPLTMTLDFPFAFSEEGNTIIAIESNSYKTTHKTFCVDGFKKTNKKCSDYNYRR